MLQVADKAFGAALILPLTLGAATDQVAATGLTEELTPPLASAGVATDQVAVIGLALVVELPEILGIRNVQVAVNALGKSTGAVRVRVGS